MSYAEKDEISCSRERDLDSGKVGYHCLRATLNQSPRASPSLWMNYPALSHYQNSHPNRQTPALHYNSLSTQL